MPLTTGSCIGQYEVLSAIGAGGMGEVYRARDTKLNRDVAIKVLPELFASDADRLARFEREAQSLAALNHPHIAQIYGVEDLPPRDGRHAGVALVMELVDGEDLAQRLARGPIPVDEVIPIARQIADALEAAHERGIVHRDLKPANIKLTSGRTVKVLDFGLAKAVDPAGSSAVPALEQAPTFTARAMTQMGVILGTAAYMAPEQARGQRVDERADIWAFGCVMYEMLTGRRAFDGPTLSDLIASVLTREPDWTALPTNTPSRLRLLLRRCLVRDPRERLRDIGDARIELADASGTARDVAAAPPVAAGIWRVGAGLIVGAVVAGGAAWLLLRPAPSAPAPIRRFAIAGLKSLLIDAHQALTLTPDGHVLAYRGQGEDGVDRLYARRLDSLEVTPLAGTEGGRLPFFSADGRWLGFSAQGALKKVAVDGGMPQSMQQVPGLFAGGTWMDDGAMVFAADGSLRRLPPAGGAPETLFTADKARGDTAVSSPWALPGSRGILLMVRHGNRFDVEVFSFADRALHPLAEDAYSPAWLPTGHIVFHQGASILAVPFDLDRLAVTGGAFPVLSGIGTRVSFQTRLFAVARDGTLAYVPAAPAGQGQSALVWVDRGGHETPIAQIDRVLDTPRLSPDGTRVAFRTPAPNCDVWVQDLARGTTTRLTQAGDNHGIVWSADGTRVIMSRALSDSSDIVSVSADGSGGTETILKRPVSRVLLPSSLSRHDGAVLVDVSSPDASVDISAIVATGKDPIPIIASPFDDTHGSFSPDGHSIAYVSNQSGRAEVYIQPHGVPGTHVQVSTDGGNEPVWSRDGREIFFRQGRKVMAARVVRAAGGVTVSRPVALFSADYAVGPLLANFDVSLDGKRFMTVKGRQWIEGEIVVVLNWFQQLTKPR